MKCSICNTETKCSTKNTPVCRSCRKDIPVKRDEMKKLYIKTLAEVRLNPKNTDLLSDFMLLKRGSFVEAIEELKLNFTKE